MRKLSLFIASAAALVAFMALGSPAFALTDPSCDGDPYNNDPVVHDFAIATPDSSMEHAVSGVEGSGLACGTDIFWPNGGQGTIYDHADVLTPPGVEINGTAGIANDRFVGTSLVNVATHFATFPVIVQDQASVLRISQISNCDAENPVGGDIPGTIIACYRGSNALGYNYNWTTVTTGGEKWLTIGPFHPSAGIAGLTHIKQFNLCGYVGAAGGSQYPADCGDSSQPFLQKNGDVSVGGPGSQGCAVPYERGLYSVTATMRNGFTTPAAKVRVSWYAPKGEEQRPPCLSTGSTPPPPAQVTAGPPPGTGNGGG